MNQITPSLFTVLSVELACCPRDAFSAPIKAYEEFKKNLSPSTPETDGATHQPASGSLVEYMVRSIPHEIGLAQPHALFKRSINWNNVIANRPAFAQIVVEGSVGFGFALLIGIILWCFLSSKEDKLKELGSHIKPFVKKNYFLRQLQKEKEAAKKKLEEEKKLEAITKTAEKDLEMGERQGSEEEKGSEEGGYSVPEGKAKKKKRGEKHAIKKKLGKIKKVAKSEAVQKHISKIKKAAKSKAIQKHVGKIKKAAKSKAIQKHVGKIKKVAKSKTVQKHISKIKNAAKSKAVQKHVSKIKAAAKSKAVQKHVGKIKKAVKLKVGGKIKKEKNEEGKQMSLFKVKENQKKAPKKEKKSMKKTPTKKKGGEMKSKKTSHKKTKHEKDQEDSEDTD